MATTQTEARAKAAGSAPPRNTRGNEIVAILLCALGVLLALCLLPFSYDPNDPSWNTVAGQTDAASNWIGKIGANVAETVFQFVGLAAYLLPLLLFAAAWRRFRTRRIHAPLSRVIGLVTLLLSAAGLLHLFRVPRPFDGKFEPGGLAGALVSGILESGLNAIGAGVLLFAAAGIGLLLATNFSFVRAYERISGALTVSPRFASLRAWPERFRAWREQRRARALERAEMRQAARLEREQQRAAAEAAREQSGAARVAGFMRETAPDTESSVAATAAIQRNAAADTTDAREQEIRAQLAQAEAELAALAADPTALPPASAKRSSGNGASKTQRAPALEREPAAPAPRASSSPAKASDPQEMEDELEEMLRTASVVRVETDEEASAPARSRPETRAARAELNAATLSDYRLPDLDFLHGPPPRHEQADEELLHLATNLAEKCREFNVTGQIKHICPGPVVTTYEFKPDPGVKYSRVTGLVDDLCLALKAESIRIDRLPGKPHVGIEVPNPQREVIFLREVIESRAYRDSPSKLSLALGKTIDGLNYVADLAKMPHLLIAGATGTGKSVCLNSLVVSILYKARPDEVKFIMVDPKRLELGLYADIPHLATPIVTDPKRAANALKWAVREMENRYKELAKMGVRNIDGYNTEVARRNLVEDFNDEGEPWQPLPYIVILIDELADLMMVSGHEVEEAITRLAQMARAVGIHLILATQRPSVDVITGLIKANFPSRISFRVSSKVDSRTIIDANGAEQLLGHGDMLFLPPGTSRLVRVHGAYVDETEIGKIVAQIKAQAAPAYDESITQSEEEASDSDAPGGEQDELFEQALRICVEMKRASTSVLQRRLRIGYGRAAAILDAMEREGYIGQADGSRPRPVLGRAFETISRWDESASEDANL